MPLPPPNVLSTSCDQASSTPTFRVTWDTTNYPPTQQYVIGLFDINSSTPVTVSNPVFGSSGTLTASQALTQTESYQLMVALYVSGQSPLWPATGLAALFVAPTGLSISFDGQNLTASWTNPPAGTMPTGGRIEIVTGGNTYVDDVGPSGGVYDTSQVPLSPSVIAEVDARPIYGTSLGPPSAQVAMIQQTTPVSLISNPGGTSWTVQMQGFLSANPRTFNVYLNADDTLIQTFPGVMEDASGNLSLTLTVAPVPGVGYEISAAQAATNSVGPVGPRAAAITAPVVVQQIAYTSGTGHDILSYELALPPGKPSVSGAQFTLNKVGSTSAVATQVVSTAIGSFQVPNLTTTDNYTLTIRSALGLPYGVSLGPSASVTPSVLTAIPSLSSVTYDGKVVSATWSASTQTGVTGYQLEIVCGPSASGWTIVASGQFSGTTGALAFAGDPAQAYGVRVRPLGPQSEGTTAQAPTLLILSGLILSQATTDPISGLTTVAWSSQSGSTYNLQLLRGGTPFGNAINTSTSPYTFTSKLDSNSSLELAISNQTTTSGVSVTGPYGLSVPLMIEQPSITSVDYNGSTVTVVWEGTPNATHYVVSILQSGATQAFFQFTTTGPVTSATFAPLITDTTHTYSVVVQATIGPNFSGPSSIAVPLFSPGFFVSTQPATADYPYIFPGVNLSLAASDIVLYLPDLGGGTALQGLPITQGAFTLASDSNAHYPYTLTIGSTTEAWTFGPQPIRSQLQTDYVSFLKLAETAGVVPLGLLTLQQAISRSMPQTFAETLYYAYGFNLTTGSVDVRPGIVLRVVFNEYVNVGNASTVSGINGFTGGAYLDYDASSYPSSTGTMMVGFDALVNQLVSGGYMTVMPPDSSVSGYTENGVSEASDLFFPGFRQPFYRLFFPSTLFSPSSPGTTFTPSCFVLSATPTYTLLSTSVNYPTGSNAVAYFRGRTIVKACIRIFVNGVEEVVPLGTTIGNLLERYANLPPSTGMSLVGVQLQRNLGCVVLDPNAPLDAGSAYPVRLDWNTQPTYAYGYSSLSLPLLHGDSLTIGT